MNVFTLWGEGRDKQQPQHLTFDDGHVKCRTSSEVVWRCFPDQIHSVVPDPSDPCRFTINVMTQYRFEAESRSVVRQVQEAAASAQKRVRDTQRSNLERERTSLASPPTSSNSPTMEPPVMDLPSPTAAESIAVEDAAEPPPLSPSPSSMRLSDLTVISELGRGAFGRVLKVQHKQSGQLYAMKVTTEEVSADSPHPSDQLLNEQRLLELVDHPGIVKCHAWFLEENSRGPGAKGLVRTLYLVLDYLPGGDLEAHLSRVGCVSESDARIYMAEVYSALRYLHSNTIVYRDLKPSNLVLDSNGHVKLVDFGLAKFGVATIGGTTDGRRTFCGTPAYLAPEILKGEPHGVAVDLWSAGILLYKMLFGSVPFYSPNRQTLYREAICGQIRFPANASRWAKAFIRSTLVREPMDRLGCGALGFREIQSHSFFSSIRWSEVGQSSQAGSLRPFSALRVESLATAGAPVALNPSSVDSDSYTGEESGRLDAEAGPPGGLGRLGGRIGSGGSALSDLHSAARTRPASIERTPSESLGGDDFDALEEQIGQLLGHSPSEIAARHRAFMAADASAVISTRSDSGPRDASAHKCLGQRCPCKRLPPRPHRVDSTRFYRDSSPAIKEYGSESDSDGDTPQDEPRVRVSSSPPPQDGTVRESREQAFRVRRVLRPPRLRTRD